MRRPVVRQLRARTLRWSCICCCLDGPSPGREDGVPSQLQSRLPECLEDVGQPETRGQIAPRFRSVTCHLPSRQRRRFDSPVGAVVPQPPYLVERNLCRQGVESLDSPLPQSYHTCVRRAAIHGMIWLVLAACLACPIMQMFDCWDHELQTGQDTESTILFFAVCIGATLVVLRAVVRVDQPSGSGPAESPFSRFVGSLGILVRAASAAAPFPSPPANLRI